MESMIYWLVLGILIVAAASFKKRASFYLSLAFYLFMAGAILRIIGINDIAELIMRISLIGWLVGLGLSFKQL